MEVPMTEETQPEVKEENLVLPELEHNPQHVSLTIIGDYVKAVTTALQQVETNLATLNTQVEQQRAYRISLSANLELLNQLRDKITPLL